MREQLLKRLERLKGEFEQGQRMLAELDGRREGLQRTLLRIGGAIQVLEEECDRPPESEAEAKPDKSLRVAAGG
jgi:predicted nuclease with TOPRIM domain